MKLKSILLGLAILASSLVPASAQISNIINSPPGISYNANVRTVVNNYSVKPEDFVILVDATTAAVTIKLPPVSAKAFKQVIVKKIDVSANAVTVSPSGSATVDGATSLSLASQYQTAILQANGTAWHNLGNPGSTTNSGTYVQTSSSSAAFASGPNGNTNPMFRLVNNVSSAATGISVTGRAAAAGVDITVLSSGTNELLRLNAKGSGTILLNETGTGAVLVGDGTNPAFGVTHTTEGTGWNITSAAEASGVSFTVTSSGTNESGTIDAKGSGGITINGTATGGITLGRDTTITSDSTGGNLGAKSTFTGIVNSTLIPFGTMTDGTASVKTKALMDDTPAAEFAEVVVTDAPTISQDSTIARKGTNSLKLAWPAAAVAGDGVEWTAFAAENWEAQESVGFWIYTDVALSAGDLTFVIVDSTGDVAFNIPAVADVNKWTWVEVNISSLAGGTGDAVTNFKILASTAGAALGAMNTYIDGAWKWDATEELALGVDLVDSPGAVRKVLAMTKANTGTHDMTALVEDTDFFVHSESGNDFLVTISNQVANSAIVLVNHKE